MEYALDKNKIYKRVQDITAHIGKNTFDKDGNSLYSEIAVTQDDYNSLDGFFEKAINEIQTSVRKLYFDSGKVVLFLPENFKQEFLSAVKTHVENAIVYSIVTSWMINTPIPDAAKVYDAQASEEIHKIIISISQRVPPADYTQYYEGEKQPSECTFSYTERIDDDTNSCTCPLKYNKRKEDIMPLSCTDPLKYNRREEDTMPLHQKQGFYNEK